MITSVAITVSIIFDYSINEISDENRNKFLSQQNLRKLNNISIRHSPSGFKAVLPVSSSGSKAAVDYARDYALIRSETSLSTCSSYQRHGVSLARCRVSTINPSRNSVSPLEIPALQIQLISLHPPLVAKKKSSSNAPPNFWNIIVQRFENIQEPKIQRETISGSL